MGQTADEEEIIMGEYMFGSGKGHLSNRADRIARKHGATLVNYTEPRGEKRHWFAAKNRGNPFDERVRDAVLADLRAAGIIEDADA